MVSSGGEEEQDGVYRIGLTITKTVKSHLRKAVGEEGGLRYGENGQVVAREMVVTPASRTELCFNC